MDFYTLCYKIVARDGEVDGTDLLNEVCQYAAPMGREDVRQRVLALVVNHEDRCEGCAELQQVRLEPCPRYDLLFNVGTPKRKVNRLRVRLHDSAQDGWWGIRAGKAGGFVPVQLSGPVSQAIQDEYARLHEQAAAAPHPVLPSAKESRVSPSVEGQFPPLGAIMLRLFNRQRGEQFDQQLVLHPNYLELVTSTASGGLLMATVVAEATLELCFVAMDRMNRIQSSAGAPIEQMLLVPAGVPKEVLEQLSSVRPNVRIVTWTAKFQDVV